jgi:hypothetical protein
MGSSVAPWPSVSEQIAFGLIGGRQAAGRGRLHLAGRVSSTYSAADVRSARPRHPSSHRGDIEPIAKRVDLPPRQADGAELEQRGPIEDRVGDALVHLP